MEDIYVQVDAGEVTVTVANKNIAITTRVELSAFDKQVLKAGGALNYLRQKLK